MSKRRSNHEGCLRLRDDGRWELTYMVGFQPNGKRKYKSFYGKTQGEVKAKAKEYWNAQHSGMTVDEHQLFSAWADIWFEGHKDYITPTTEEGYRYTLRVLKDAFGGHHIVDIRALDVELFLKELRCEGRSYSYIAHCRGMLYQIFNKAEANGIVSRNPVEYAEKIRRPESEQRKECFTAEEIAILFRLLPDDRLGWSIKLLLSTGMRVQEILALEPRHIEADGSCIYIRQAVKVVGGKVFIGPPKSKESYRNVPVPECVRECAIKLRATDTKFVWEMGKKNSPCNPSTFRKNFKIALKNVPGVRVLTPHSCRHSYVSQLQALGVDMSTIQSLVGHADIDMTNHYLHVQPSIQLDAAERFSKAFQPQ